MLNCTRSIYKNQLYFHILAINSLKMKLRKHTISSKKVRYLGIHLEKEVHNLHNENYKVLSKKIKEDLNKLNTSHVHESIDLIIL